MDLKSAHEMHSPGASGQEPAAEALRESQALLAGIVISAVDAIVTVGPDRRISAFNRAAETLFGCPAEEAIGQSLQDFGGRHVTTGDIGGPDAVFGGCQQVPMQAEIAAEDGPELE